MTEDFDPEMLPPVEKIRYAEQLIRREHRVLDDDWMFWGNLADHLNMVALTPEKANRRQSEWREFSRAQDMAIGYIRMSARPHLCGCCVDNECECEGKRIDARG